MRPRYGGNEVPGSIFLGTRHHALLPGFRLDELELFGA